MNGRLKKPWLTKTFECKGLINRPFKDFENKFIVSCYQQFLFSHSLTALSHSDTIDHSGMQLTVTDND